VARSALLLLFLAASCTAGGETTSPWTGRPSAVDGSAPRFEPERRWGGATENHWEPVVAADPESSWVYQMTTGQTPNAMLFRASSDGGRTWGEGRGLCRRGVRVPWQFDPQIAVGAGGVIDVVCLNGFTHPGIVFAQSTDHGASWSRAVRLDGTLHYGDKPTLVLAHRGKDVYVSFSGGYVLYVAASHDYGASWSPPQRATTRHFWYYSLGGTATHDGAVWFAVDGESGHDQTGDGHIGLVTSADGGSTWREIPIATTHEGAACRVRHCYPDFYTGEDAVAADDAGHLVFAYAQNDRKQGPNALYVTHSRDGRRWTAPATIEAQGNSTSPAIAAAPGDGDFRLVWQDDRNGAKSWNTWYARSLDGGATWSSALRLSDRATGGGYKHAAGYDFPFGDYLGLSVDSNGVNHVIWGEGSAVYVPGGTWWTLGK